MANKKTKIIRKIRSNKLNPSLAALFLCILIAGVFFAYHKRNPRVLGVEEIVDVQIPEFYTQSLKVTRGDNELTVTPLSGANVRVERKDNQLIYHDAYPNTDIVQTDYHYRIKEEIIFKQPGHPTEFRYRLGNIEHYNVEEDVNGNIIFYNKESYEKLGKDKDLSRVFTIPAPFLEDSRNERSYAVTAIIEGDLLIVKINQSWLQRAQYPVIVDPSIEINVINVRSHPQEGDNWAVSFTAQGRADLKIIPYDEATIRDDEFVSLTCDGEERTPEILDGGVIYYPDWHCSGTGKVVHYTRRAGKHTLKFDFGGQIAFAYNDAGNNPWWNDDWLYRKAIIINHDKVTGDLSNFPLLVSITDADLAARARADGQDIVFTGNGGGVLKFEIESYASTTGELVAWVKIPALSSTADTALFMYYGNAGASDLSDSAGVWDENYKGVWHLGDGDSTDAGFYKDSTANENDGTLTDANGNSGETTGKIGQAMNFYGDGDGIDLTSSSNFIPSLNSTITISAWVNADTISSFTVINRILCIHKGATAGSTLVLTLGTDDNIQMYNDNNTTTYNWSNTVTTGNMYYVTLTYNGSDFQRYYNGGADGSTITASLTAGGSFPAQIGIYSTDSNYDFDGIIDEVRVSDTARSADWIQTEYNNQASTTEFISAQAEEVGPGAVGYWTFDEGYGAMAHDESGQGNDGAITGAVWQDESMCVTGKCLYFDGSGDKVSIPNLIPRVKTINFWAKPASTTTSFLELTEWYGGFAYRRPVTIQSNRVKSTEIDFPVLATTTGTYLKHTDNGGKIETQQGYDLVWTDSDGVTLLNFEAEKHSTTTGEIVYWIKVNVSSTTDKTIYMYYGSSTAPNLSTTTGVWDNDYAAVHHFEETDIDGGVGDIKDSTIQKQDGTTKNMNSSDQVSGKIGGSFDFDGADDYVDLDPTTSGLFDIDPGESGTISFWLKGGTQSATKNFFNSQSSCLGIMARMFTNGALEVNFASGPSNCTGATYYSAQYAGNYDDSKWHYYTAVIDRPNTSLELFVDGASKDTKSPDNNNPSNAGNVHMGTDWDNGRPYDGIIDEFRFSTTPRPNGWIETEYNNQLDAASFLQFGSEVSSFDTAASSTATAEDGKIKTGGFTAPSIYVNGVNTSRITDNEWQMITITTDTVVEDRLFNIGTVVSSSFTGFIDEVKIYPYARTADEIRQDYAAGVAGIGSSHGVSASFGGKSDKWLTDGLVGYWKFDEPINTYDDDNGFEDANDSSGNNNTGDANGNASTTAGKFGNGGSFDGTGDYADVANESNFDFNYNDSFTFSAWIYGDGIDSGENDILGKYSSAASPGYNLTIAPSGTCANGCVFLNLNDGSDKRSSVYTSDGSVPAQTWMHVVAVYNGNGSASGINLYVNGARQTLTIFQNDRSGSILNNANLRIGTDLPGVGDDFDGQIDEVRIYNRALSPAEVRHLYEWAPGPVARWKFDEHARQTAYDSVASTTYSGGNNGTLGASASAGSDDPTWTQGKYGGALSFDGIDDYVDAGNGPSLDISGTITVEAWVKIDTDVIGRIAAKHLGGSYGWMLTRDANTDNIEWRISTNGTNWLGGKTGADTFEINTWYHIASTYDSSNMRVYINGIEDTGGDFPSAQTGSINVAPNSTQIGIDLIGDFPFDGLIDDVRIYNYARTQKQILEDMNGGRPAAKSPVLHLSFDKGYGSTTHDSSINKNNATLQYDTNWSNDGKFGKGLDFDGTNDFAAIPAVSSLSPGDGSWSVSVWAKPANQDQAAALIYNDASTPPEYPKWGIGFLNSTRDGAGKKFWAVYQESYSGLIWRASGSVNDQIDGNWHQYAMVADKTADEVKLFVDSKEITKTLVNSGAWPNIDTSAQPTRIGVDVGGLFFKGLMDEVKVWNYALTGDELKIEYNQGQAAVMGAGGTATTTAGNIVPDWSKSRQYCVPGSDDYCAPPVGEWKMDEKEGATAYDTSGHGNDGSLGGGTPSYYPAWSRGHHGNALDFDGTDDEVYVGSPTSLNISGPVTVSGWVKFERTGQQEGLFGRGNHTGATADRGPYFIGVYNNEIWWSLSQNDTTVSVLNSSLTYNTSNWYYIVGTWDGTTGTNSQKIYINGSLYDQKTSTVSSLENQYGVVIGNKDIATNPFQGLIDEVKIYDYARTPAQIAWDYNRGKPTAYYKFDECQGGTIHDQSYNCQETGDCNHGQLYIGTSGTTATGTCASSSDSFWYNGKTGKRNHAGSFDGTDDYVKISNNYSYEDVTMSAWFYVDTFAGSAGIVNKFLNTSDAWGIVWSTTLSALTILDDIDNANAWRYPTTVSAGQWYHAVAVMDSLENKLYLDGKLVGSGQSSSDNLTSFTGNLYIGARLTGLDEFKGQIDEVKIWNYALTPLQVKTEYNGGAVRFGN